MDFKRILYLWRHICLLLTQFIGAHDGKKSLQPVIHVDEVPTLQMQLVYNADIRH
jgi:hypothetical protein